MFTPGEFIRLMFFLGVMLSAGYLLRERCAPQKRIAASCESVSKGKFSCIIEEQADAKD